MTEDLPLTPEQEDQALAAELALGLLDGPEAEAAVARLSTDLAFAQLVRDWQERLAALAESLTPVMAPARARQGIRERLGHSAAPLSEDPAAPSGWWRGPWAVLAGLLAVAVLAAILVLPALPGREAPAPAGPDYRAELLSEDQALRVSARVEGREMEIALESGPAAAGRDYEIWWIEPDGSAPISIGLVPRTGNLRMALPAGLEPSDAIRIALSDEPEGGSPTGQATGPVVAIASLTPS
ncbi:anti-sigma factor [Paracoccus bogoriensis]|uniref:anti-sigma factor n=1 Tax=Paracoccus bogoriensis TaxID=242065 RepID=UPI001CA53E4C|nr:anti-sigma factor [Paracoccus bogoriensis]MBW7056570.1 anti-sigma factor [Paracoccus bogoriensis]